jgi:environmental stress-induced protein Ves
MRLIKPEFCKRLPWLNGGGETIELAIYPEGASFSNFGWRLSAARVTKNGPFSHFQGIDRTLIVTSGHGLMIKQPDSCSMTVTGADQPWEFCGEIAVEASLIDGPVEDLNVMTRRGLFSHKMEVKRISRDSEVFSQVGVSIISLRDSSGSYETALGRRGTLGAGDFILLEDGEGLQIIPEAEGLLYEIKIWPV